MYKDENYQKKYYEEHKEAFRGYAKTRREKLGEEFNKIIRKWRRENPERQKAIQYKYAIKYKMNNPKIIKAHQITQLVKIPKGTKCEICNIRLAREKHHEDYDNPTKLMFLCKKCHRGRTPKPIKTQSKQE